MANSYLPGLDNFPSGIDEDRLAAGLLAVEQGRHSQQSVTEAVLVSGVDATLGEDIVCTLTANRVMGRPLNGVAGQRLQLVLTQGGAGNFTLTAGTGVTFSNFALNPAVGAVTTASLVCLSPTSWVLALNPPTGKIYDTGGWAVNVTAAKYNPKGDGVTLDTAAFNSASADAGALGGAGIPSILLIPPPPGGVTYLVGSITMPSALTVQAPGWVKELGESSQKATMTLAAGTNDYMWKTNATDYTNNVTQIWVFRDLEMDGNAPNQTTGGGLIEAKGSVHCQIFHCHFFQAYTAMVHMTGKNNGQFGHNNEVLDCLFDHTNNSGAGTPKGIWFEANDENIVTNCDFQYMKGYCIHDQGGLQLIDTCAFVNGVAGCQSVRIDFKDDTRVQGCTFDSMLAECVWSQGQCHSISDNYFYRCQGNNIVLTAGFGSHSIVGNRFRPASSGSVWGIQDLGTGLNSIIGNTVYNGDGTFSSGILNAITTGTVVMGNGGAFKDRAFAAGTLAAATTTAVTFAQALVLAPPLAGITVTFSGDCGQPRFWVTAITASGCTLNFPAAATAVGYGIKASLS